MSTTDVNQQKKKVISPNLDDVYDATDGVYYVQNVWIIDDATLQPVGVKQEVTFS